MGNKFFIAILAAVAVFFGVVIFSKQDAKAPEGTQATSSNYVHGEGTSGVELVEFGDFECPSCAAYYPVVNQIKQEFGDEITFRFRHFPLIQIHQNAMAAHRAAEAAGKQGKFFEMHDLLFERRNSWVANNGVSTSQAAGIFEQFATELGLDIEQFKTDLASESTIAAINADIELGKQAGATGTPTFVLNGRVVPLEEIRDAEAFIAKIRAEIEAAKTRPATQ